MLVVNPKVYYAAAGQLAALADDIDTALARDLVPRLATSSGMGGNYPAVTGWNTAYHQNAGDLRTTVLSYTAALRHY
jgi:hypothetical protein